MCKWKKRICFLFHNILVGFILQFSTLYFYISTLSVWIWTFVPRAGLGILHKLIFVLKVLIMEMEFGAVCVFCSKHASLAKCAKKDYLPTNICIFSSWHCNWRRANLFSMKKIALFDFLLSFSLFLKSLFSFSFTFVKWSVKP